MRPGVTLIEVVVALTIFQIVMLALTATTIVAARDLSVANRRARALELAERRVAELRAGACAGGSSGSAAVPGLREFWSVNSNGAIRAISDSVQLTHAHGSESLVVRAWVYCP